MKKINLKFISILFIALYCLAPLCAADLNQSNIAEDNKDNVEIIKVSNETENKQNNNLKEIHYDLPLEVHVDDVTKGEKIVVEITTSDFISAGVQFYIYGPNHYSQLNYVFLEHGYGSFEIDSSNLPAGEYRVKAFADASYMDGEAETTFTVYP